jgi:histidinol-phosphate aminotransferase
MFEIDKLVRENIKRLVPYSSARDDYKGRSGVFLDANENPFGSLNRYPDPYQRQLKIAICQIKGVDEESVFLGNGSDEIIDLCLRVFCNPGVDKAIVFPPTYGMYEVSSAINDVAVIKVPLNDDFQINIEETEPFFQDETIKMIFICSPNNPTGNCMNHDDVEHVINKFNGIVLLDEAYVDFCDKPSFVNKISRYPNLIVMQTFSKALGLAAVRIGIAFSHPSVIRYLNSIKPPYNISTLNQETALKSLADKNIWLNHATEIKKERERLSIELLKLNITEIVYPSDANFLLVKVKDANFIYNYLVNNKIIVRNRSSLLNNCLRITIGTRNENDKLMNALNRLTL